MVNEPFSNVYAYFKRSNALKIRFGALFKYKTVG